MICRAETFLSFLSYFFVSMRFSLEGSINFSKPPGEKAVASILDSAKDLLQKGAPKGKGAVLSSFSLSKNVLSLSIASGRHVRPHDAIIRLKKALAKSLGKEFKIGVRSYSIDKYEIVLDIPGDKHLADTLSRLPMVSSAKEGKNFTILLEDVPQENLDDNSIDRLVTLAVSLSEEKPAGEEKVVFIKGSKEKNMLCDRNPADTARQLGWIKEFPGKGQWIYTEPYARLLRAIEQALITEVAKPLGFEEVLLPKLIPFDVEKKMPGYFSKMPAHMFYSCPPGEESGLDLFKYKYDITREPDAKELARTLRDPAYVLSPSQCEPSYALYEGESFSDKELPVKFFDRSGWTYRFEHGGVEGIVRTQEFMRLELVYFAYPKEVVSIRDQILERSLKVVGDLLDIEWRVVVGVPWYSVGKLGTEDFKDSMNVPTYDIEAYLPYRGSRDSEWLEIFSGNNNGDKFTRSFHIKESKNKELWSGCTGFGITRWVAAFLAQKGFDQSKWPEGVNKLVGELPDVSKCLTWPRRLK